MPHKYSRSYYCVIRNVSNKAVSTLQLYGKMSLTNYITQSVVGAVIYFPFVFYLAPYCGYAASYLIEFILFGSQIWLCKWWLTKHKQG